MINIYKRRYPSLPAYHDYHEQSEVCQKRAREITNDANILSVLLPNINELIIGTSVLAEMKNYPSEMSYYTGWSLYKWAVIDDYIPWRSIIVAPLLNMDRIPQWISQPFLKSLCRLELCLQGPGLPNFAGSNHAISQLSILRLRSFEPLDDVSNSPPQIMNFELPRLRYLMLRDFCLHQSTISDIVLRFV